MSASPAPTPTRSPAANRLDAISSWFLRPSVLIRTVLYLTLAVYLRTVLFDYVYDDVHLIVTNPAMTSWAYVPAFFTHSFWGFNGLPLALDYYRPLVMVVLACIYHLLGTAPGWFHLFAFAIHILATYLVYRLVVETAGDKTLASVSAGIFGLHPTRVETAAWISGISDSLSVVFFLASMIFYFRSKREPQHRVRDISISVALLLLALLSKEAAIFSPLLIGIYEFSAIEDRFRNRFVRAIRASWPFAAAGALVMGARILLVRIPAGQLLNHIPLRSTLLTAPKTIVWYLGKQVWPLHLSVQYPKIVVNQISFSEFVLPFLILALLSLAVALRVRTSALGIFLASWFVVMLAPAIVFQVLLQEHDRYSYLPSVAASIGIAWLLLQLRAYSPRLQSVVVASVFVSLAVLTFVYSSYWDNDIKLFARAVEIAPDNARGCNELAQLYLNMHQPEKAEELAHKLINGGTEEAMGWYILGEVRSFTKNYAESRDAMQTALRLWSGNDLLPTMGLANADLHLNRNEEAIELYRREIDKFPNMALLHTQLAQALGNLGKSEEAAREVALQRRLR